MDPSPRDAAAAEEEDGARMLLNDGALPYNDASSVGGGGAIAEGSRKGVDLSTVAIRVLYLPQDTGRIAGGFYTHRFLQPPSNSTRAGCGEAPSA
jgi:hypothetical protein